MMEPAFPKAPRRQPPPALALGAALGLLLATPSAALAEEAKTLPTVTYNKEIHAFEQILPHRTPFNIQISGGSVDKKYNTFLATYWEEGGDKCSEPQDSKDKTTLTGGAGEIVGEKRKYQVQVPRLKYSKAYCFKFTFGREFVDEDRASIKLAMVKTFQESVKKGFSNKAQIHEILVKELADNASVQVDLLPPAKGSVPLIDLLESHFFDPNSYPTSKPYLDAGAAWKRYHDEDQNLRTRIAELVAAEPVKVDSFGKLPPSDVKELQAFQDQFKAVSAIAKELKVDSELTAEQAAALRLEKPTSIESMVKKLGEPLDVLHGQADKLQTKHCGAKAILDPDRKKVCDATVIAVLNSTEVASKHLKGMNEAQLSYVKLEDALSDQIKREVAGFHLVIDPFSSVSAGVTYTERSSFYISADVGMVVPIFVGGGGADVAPFLGVNVYFTGVDKEVPLREDDGLLKRLSLTGGITLSSIRDSKKTIEGVVNGNALLGGAGVRVTDYLRAGAGLVILRQSDENPVATTTKHVRVAPYVALSIDVDVASIVAGSYAKFK